MSDYTWKLTERNGAYIAAGTLTERDFGLFCQKSLALRISAPVLTIIDQDGDAIIDCPLPKHAFSNGKRGWFLGGPGVFVGDNRLQVQLTQSVDKHGNAVPNRHRFQVLAFGA